MDREDIVRGVNGSCKLNDIVGWRPGWKVIRLRSKRSDRVVRKGEDTQAFARYAVDNLLPVRREAWETTIGGPVCQFPPRRPIRAHHHDSSGPGSALKENAESKGDPLSVRRPGRCKC